MQRMERLQVQLARELTTRLRRLACQPGVSIAAPVRAAVDRAMSDPLRPPTPDERWRRSLSVAGRYRSGSTEPVSVEPDRDLEDVYRS
jgi:hypothetical protein